MAPFSLQQSSNILVLLIAWGSRVRTAHRRGSQTSRAMSCEYYSRVI